MNQSETKKILNIVAGTYSGFVPTEDSVDAWRDALGDRSFEDVRAALSAFIKRNKKAFAPSPGELLALLPAGGGTQPEQIEWNSTATEYTIRRGVEMRTYQCASPEEKKAEQRAMEARGYRRVVEKRPRGHAVFYVPNAWRQA